ncbi:nucleoside phosphorylase domain-containing protein [Aspergillus recurvatus]
MDTNAVAAGTERLRLAFPSLKHALLVGIAGGVPRVKADVRLGDLVVGQPNGQYEGVVQYHFGKTLPGGFSGMLVERVTRDEDTGIFSTIASGDEVIKDGVTRDRIRTKLREMLCFETEAAGVVNVMPCLVIRGICENANSHGNGAFQPFAATTAACAREILLYPFVPSWYLVRDSR